MTSKLRKKYTLNREDGPQCEKCLRRFATNWTLRNHKARIHEGKTSKDFECPKCHKTFSFKHNLTRHDKLVHLELREHVCEVCSRAFGENRNLQAHIRKWHSHTFIDDEDEDDVNEDEDDVDEDDDEARSDDHCDDDNADGSDSESSSLEELLRKRLASRNKRRRSPLE
jgi:hypothetical protein